MQSDFDLDLGDGQPKQQLRHPARQQTPSLSSQTHSKPSQLNLMQQPSSLQNTESKKKRSQPILPRSQPNLPSQTHHSSQSQPNSALVLGRSSPTVTQNLANCELFVNTSIEECFREFEKICWLKKEAIISDARYSVELTNLIVDIANKALDKHGRGRNEYFNNKIREMGSSLMKTIVTMNSSKRPVVTTTNEKTTVAGVNKISVDDLIQDMSSDEVNIDDMPDFDPLFWGIRPIDCEWDKFRIILPHQSNQIDEAASEQSGWRLFKDEKSKLPLAAINVDFMFKINVDKQTIRIFENLRERVHFLMYR